MKPTYANYYKRFQQLSKRPEAKISGLISLTIFAVAFFGLFAILPTFKTIAQLSKEIEDAETVNSKLAKKILALDTAEQSYGQILEKLETVEAVLPEKAGFERLAWQLHWLANDKDLEVSGGNFGEFEIIEQTAAASDELKELAVEFTIRGSYGQIKDFIKELTRMDRLITVNEVVIGSKRLKSDSGGISANLRLTAYYLPPLILPEEAKND